MSTHPLGDEFPTIMFMEGQKKERYESRGTSKQRRKEKKAERRGKRMNVVGI
jgi:hypothetical protein